MSIEIKEQHAYKPKITSMPRYRFRELTTQSTAPATLTAARQAMTFEISPSLCFNPGKSVIQATLSATAQAGDFTFLHAGVAPFASLVWTTDLGVELARINNLQYYSRVVPYHSTKAEDFGEVVKGQYSSIFGVTAGDGSAALDTGTDFGVISNAGATLNTATHKPTPCSYLSGGADNTAVAINLRIPLADLAKHTALGMNKDIWMPERSYVTIELAEKSQIGFDADDYKLANAGALVAGTVSNVSLQLAVQMDKQIADTIRQTVLGGMIQMNVGYVVEQKTTTSAGTSHTETLKLSGANGKRLLRVYQSYNVNTGNQLVCNVNNRTHAKVSVLEPSINGSYVYEKPINYYDVLALKGDFYRGSLFTNQQVLEDFFCWVDDFSGANRCWELDQHAEVGIDLTQEQLQYAISTTKTGAAYEVYTAAVVQRVLTISQAGTQISAF